MSQFGQRLAEEAEVLRSLTHPNIIQYKGWKPGEDGIHALVMEHGHRSLQVLLMKIQFCFLAVQNSSIGDLVTHSLTHFYFCHTKSNPRDLLPLRHLIRVMRRHDMKIFDDNFLGQF